MEALRGDLAGVGASLRQLRLRNAMTLRALADKLGCSESLLSKIERGRQPPTLHMLHRIALELDFEVGAVLGGDGLSKVTVHDSGDRPQIRLQGHRDTDPPVLLERAIPWREDCVLDANLHVVPPGGGSEGFLSHVGEEVGFVVSGTIEITIDGTCHQLSRGASFYFDSRLPHSYVNVGDTAAEIFWVNGLRHGSRPRD